MAVALKRRLKTENFSIQKFLFIDDIKDSLRGYDIRHNKPECRLELIYTNFKHHAEIYDILITEGRETVSLVSLFSKFYLFVIPEQKKLKIYLSPKEKLDNGNHIIEGYLSELRNFFKKNIDFVQGNYDEVIFLD